MYYVHISRYPKGKNDEHQNQGLSGGINDLTHMVQALTGIHTQKWYTLSHCYNRNVTILEKLGIGKN